MTQNDVYLLQIIDRYKPRDLASHYLADIPLLKTRLRNWASTCYLDILDSGSRAKGTAISLASDVDFLISLSSNCNSNSGGLSEIYNSLFNVLNQEYTNVRKQNVSIRINLNGLEVDITPARRLVNTIHYHNLYVSKSNTWKQTNIQKHIIDISQSNRLNEIKLLKIWRNLHSLEFPSIYLEYLLVTIILNRRSIGNEYLADNFIHILRELAKTESNPIFSRIIDPSNTSNILSDLLNAEEKSKIINQAQLSLRRNWNQVLW